MPSTANSKASAPDASVSIESPTESQQAYLEALAIDAAAAVTAIEAKLAGMQATLKAAKAEAKSARAAATKGA